MRKLLEKIWKGGNQLKYGNDETPDSLYFGYLIGITLFVFVSFFALFFLL